MKTAPLKLSDRGTSGLLQWIAAGEEKLPLAQAPGIHKAKVARAAAIIRKRYGAEAEMVFRGVARREKVARDSVRRLTDGGAIICQATIYESDLPKVDVRELLRRAGRPNDYGHACNAARDTATDESKPSWERALCRDFLAIL